MSFSTSDLPTTILFIAIGVIIGAALSKILNRGPSATELQQKLEESQEQLNKYQKDVDSHFQKTAELVNNLTESYRAVHEHLSQGAQKLTHHSSNTLESTQFKALAEPEAEPATPSEAESEQLDQETSVQEEHASQASSPSESANDSEKNTQ